MSNIIEVKVQGEEPHLLGGPVPVLLAVTNHDSKAASVLLPYPNPNNLSFRCLSSDFAQAKQVEPDPIERTVPTVIQANGNVTRHYYLNRYFRFAKPGKSAFAFELQMLVKGGGPQDVPTNQRFTGTFEIQLMSPSDDELRKELGLYQTELNSADRLKKEEAAEALAFLDTPQVVPYLLPMLQNDNLAEIGIRALGRHPSSESQEAIRSMLAHPELGVVSAALEEIDHLKIPIPRQAVQKLLTAANPGIQWLALGWLAARPSREDLPVLTPLLESENAPLRERAREYSKHLQEIR
jgi:hypothetical protein